MLAVIRLSIVVLIPHPSIWFRTTVNVLGLRITVNGHPTPPPSSSSFSGILFVCNHRTFLDPVVVSGVLNRRVVAMNYSLSSIWEALSPMPTFRLSRVRKLDEERIKRGLATSDLVPYFYPTTARGWKALDPVFFNINLAMEYEITFLEKLPVESTCSHGKSANNVANLVQRQLATYLNFENTNFTRKDKYSLLAGNDGTIV
uniref:Phospholipid/glycerol acyltransferase domain-containing protein n=1 Tax=Chenopodium quinoa TaxID=63459 RepID=A0A803LS88_CHEQI